MCPHSDIRVWLYTFSNPFTNVSTVAKALNMSPNTARKPLNQLVKKGLLFTDRHTKRNKKFRNYKLVRILSKRGFALYFNMIQQKIRKETQKWLLPFVLHRETE